jgi:predicted ATPase
MLEFAKIRRFKTLLEADFPLFNLNIFSGLNGMGKSSLIQTLLLLRQSYEQNTLFSQNNTKDQGLLLQGNYVNLGVGSDVLSTQAEISNIEFLFKWENLDAIDFSFEFKPNSELLPISKNLNLTNIEDISLFNKKFQYLAAERIAPKNSYPMSYHNINDLNSIGIYGEYTTHFIAENSLKNISIPELKHEKAEAKTFIANINAWMGEISPGVRINANVIPQSNIATLAYNFVQGNDTTGDFKPQNVGFGLTYSLPIIVSLLRAKPNDLLIIENPESHLHPAGQSALGKLCALAANSGVQLIIETHSDHFLNGIRVAVKKSIIPPEKVKIFFLHRKEYSSEHSSFVFDIELDENGNLDQWPVGFFDEFERNLEQLL